MEQQHTQEPWETYIDEHDGCCRIATKSDDLGVIYAPEDASRIVACVNACAGISTEDIQLLGSTWIVTIDNIKQQRDELLSLIKNDAFAMSFQSMGQYRTALIASGKGGAA